MCDSILYLQAEILAEMKAEVHSVFVAAEIKVFRINMLKTTKYIFMDVKEATDGMVYNCIS